MYIALDGEMGGIGNVYSLLTMYFQVVDDKFNRLDELYLYLKPNDGNYVVCGEAMGVNRIDIFSHDYKAITYKEGGTALYEFLKKNSTNGSIKLVPIGHGCSGDFDQIFDKLMARKTWETFVSYRRIDTSIVLQFLKLCGSISQDVSGSLESLVTHFGITQEGQLHDAKTDVLATIEVLKRLVDIEKNGNAKMVDLKLTEYKQAE